MDSPVHPRLQRKAKDQALENPVWGSLQKKQTRKRERSPMDNIAPIPKRVRAKPVKSGATKARTPAPLLRTENSKSSKRPPPLASDSEDNVEVSQPQRSKKKVVARVFVEQSDIDSDDASKQSASDRTSSSDIEELDSESEPVESIAEALFGEVPAIANAQQKKPAKSTSGRPQTTRNDPSQSPTPPPPVWGSQYKSSSAKEKKYAAEVPIKSNKHSSVAEEDEEDDDSVFNIKTEPSMSESSHADPMANLVYTKTGSVRLTDQNTDLRKVIQHGILEVKAYIAFKHGYPELVAKNSYAREILLQAAKHHKTVPIEKRILMLVRACFALISRMSPINVPQDTSDSVITAMPSLTCLLASHSYIFPQIFDAEGLPSPKRQKPYQGQPVVDTLYEFAQRFVDIAKNKAGRPEVPIPMVAIVSTAIHATLIAKKNKAGDDFKFTGNQFCDIYTYHVALLEKIRKTAPVKFHKMMADIYEEVQGFRRDTIGVYDKDTDLALLDLDGMDDE
ncbi:hypothetical protein EDD22DRAFT_960929 [Suillus occidentalis]|nr:hypothetical protein EDD22DRAFT_960929 [Suillus occidentalis]